jgi:hypothetical protein
VPFENQAADLATVLDAKLITEGTLCKQPERMKHETKVVQAVSRFLAKSRNVKRGLKIADFKGF